MNKFEDKTYEFFIENLKENDIIIIEELFKSLSKQLNLNNKTTLTKFDNDEYSQREIL